MSSKTSHQRMRNNPRKRSNKLTLREWPPNSSPGKELYYFDTNNGVTPSASWTVYNGLCAIPSTAGVPDRQGLRVTPIAFEWNFVLGGDNGSGFGTASVDASVRIILFQTRYAAPIAADLLTSTTLITAPYNMAHIGQSQADATIKVLYDHTFAISKAAQSTYPVAVTIPASDLMVKHMRFADYTASDPVNGGIYFALFTNNTLPAKFGSLYYHTRLLYNDA